jgi:hypothetical protein
MSADEFASFADATPDKSDDEFSGFADADSPAEVTKGGLFHSRLPTGEDVYSKTDPGAAAIAPTPRSAADVAAPENLTAGIGKGMVDLGRGSYQLGASIGHAAGLVSDQKMAQIQQNVDESHDTDSPLMATGAGHVGDAIGQSLPMLAMPGAGIIGSAAEGALTGAIQPVASGQSRLQNIGAGSLGGAAGAAAGKVIGGVMGGFGGAGSRQASVDLLKSEGIPVSVAQATKTKSAQQVERLSAITSDDASEFAGKQQVAFNQAAMKRMGVTDPNATAATPQVMADTDDRIGAGMNAIASRTAPQFDNQLMNDLAGIEHDAYRQLPPSDIIPIRTNISDILENAVRNGGSLDGQFVQKLNSNLKALGARPETAPIASDLQEAIHSAVARYAAPGDQDAMVELQRQFRAMKQIEGAADKTTGNISVPSLLNQMGQKAYGGRNQVIYGRGDQSLVSLARAAKQVIPDNLGNSGTAERLLPAMTGLDIAASGEPVKGAIRAALSVSSVNAMGRAMRSQGLVGKYLQNGLPVLNNLAPDVRAWAPVVGYGAAETRPRDQSNADTTSRATGGKVDHEALAEKLHHRFKSAVRAENKSTKPLLHVPDAHIASALKIAQAHI